jgi:hypothetical protein
MKIGLPRPQDLNIAFQGAMGGAQRPDTQPAALQQGQGQSGFGLSERGSGGQSNPFFGSGSGAGGAGGAAPAYNPFEAAATSPTSATKFGSYQASGLDAVKGVDITNPNGQNGFALGFGGQMNQVGTKLFVNA